MESPEEESEWLFGDNLKDRVSQLKGENSVGMSSYVNGVHPRVNRRQLGLHLILRGAQDSSFSRIPQRSNYKPPPPPPKNKSPGGGGGSTHGPQTQK